MRDTGVIAHGHVLETDRQQVYRLVQYLSRLIAWYLVRRGSIDTADRFIGLRNGLMQARRGVCTWSFLMCQIDNDADLRP